MRRLVRETLDVRNPQSSRFSSVKKALAVAAPLLAGLTIGCSDENLADECRTYNETTVTLNRGTDGRSIDLRSLENIPRGSFLTDYQIDFINEAHAIASEGIPPETKATQVPRYCSLADGDQPKSAYAQQSADKGRARGLYVPENPELDSITLINLVSHEIGHLQPGNPQNGSEVMSQLNEYEQKLAGFKLLFNQGADSGQLIRWASYESHSNMFRRLVSVLAAGRGRPGSDPLDAYDKANMFIFMRLGEYGGDIMAIREEFRERVANNTLDEALDAASSDFLTLYANRNSPELFVDARIRLMVAVQMQYGVAETYFQAHSQLLDSGLVFGLEGMNCALTVPPPASAAFTPCSDDICTGTGADSSHAVNLSLCCVSADVQADGIGFSKWDVEAGGTEYRKNGGKVSVLDFNWDSVMYLSATKTAIGLDVPCG